MQPSRISPFGPGQVLLYLQPSSRWVPLKWKVKSEKRKTRDQTGETKQPRSHGYMHMLFSKTAILLLLTIRTPVCFQSWWHKFFTASKYRAHTWLRLKTTNAKRCSFLMWLRRNGASLSLSLSLSRVLPVPRWPPVSPTGAPRDLLAIPTVVLVTFRPAPLVLVPHARKLAGHGGSARSRCWRFLSINFNYQINKRKDQYANNT